MSRPYRCLSILLALMGSVQAHATDIDKKLFYLPNTEIDVASYTLELKVPSLGLVDLPAKVRIRLTALAPLTAIKLHASQESIAVSHAWVNGVQTSTQYVNGFVLKVALPKPLAAGDEAEIELDYQIVGEQLDSSTNQGLFFQPAWQGIDVLAVEDWPYFTRRWLPCNDSPIDPATFELTVSVPKGLKALSNGKLLDVDKSRVDADTFHWKSEAAFPTYDLNLVVGDYFEYKQEVCFDTSYVNDQFVACAPGLNRTTVYLYAPNNGYNVDFKWEGVLEAAKSVVFFSSVLGEYRFEKVAFVMAPQHFMMEYPSLITSMNGSVHEIAHHWFGNSVWISHWGSFWISEGFTTYIDEGLYHEFKTGLPFPAKSTKDVDFSFSDKTDPLQIFNDGPYHTGASAIASLRMRLAKQCGFTHLTSTETAFFQEVIRSIYQAHIAAPLGTLGLIDYLRMVLPAIAQAHGCTFVEPEVSTQIDAWASEWFN